MKERNLREVYKITIEHKHLRLEKEQSDLNKKDRVRNTIE
jgi:hypothetical protein